jgi:hypothetical protein
MKLINNKTFASFDIDEKKISCYSHKEYSILEGDVVETKYIRELASIDKYRNFTIAAIVQYSDEEKTTIDAKINDEQAYNDYIASFKGFKYKLATHGSILSELNPYHAFYKIGLLEMNDVETVYSETGDLTKTKTFWNNLQKPFYDVLTDTTILADDGTKMFELEINPLLANETTNTTTV